MANSANRSLELKILANIATFEKQLDDAHKLANETARYIAADLKFTPKINLAGFNESLAAMWERAKFTAKAIRQQFDQIGAMPINIQTTATAAGAGAAAPDLSVYKKFTGQATDDVLKTVFAVDKLENELKQMGATSKDAQNEIDRISAELKEMISDVRRTGETWKQLGDTLKSSDYAKYIDFETINKNTLRSSKQVEDVTIRSTERIVNELKKMLQRVSKEIVDFLRLQMMKQTDHFNTFLEQQVIAEGKIRREAEKTAREQLKTEALIQKAKNKTAENAAKNAAWFDRAWETALNKVETANNKTAAAQLKADQAREKAWKRAQRDMENYFQRFIRLTKESINTGFAYRPFQQWLAQFNQFSRAATFITEYWSRKFIQALRFITDAGIEFTRAMSEMIAAMPEAADTKEIEKFIRTLATEMPQTATEIARAGTELAKMGDNAAAIENKLKPVVQLAQDFKTTEKSAVTLNAALKNFNLTNDEASRVADIFAAVMDDSAANASHLANGIKALKGITAVVKTDISEFGAALQITSDRGLTGNVAMRGLRESLSRLSRAPKAVQDALANMGIALEEVNPATNDLSTILARLNKSGVAEQKNIADLNRLFGQHAGTMSILIRNYEEFSAKAAYLGGDQVLGRLQTRFGKLTDNLEGDIKLFASSVQELQLKIFKAIEDSLRGMAQAGKALIDTLTDSGAATKAAADVFNNFGKTVESVTRAIEKNPQAVENAAASIAGIANSAINAAGFLAKMNQQILDLVKFLGYVGGAAASVWLAVNAMKALNAVMLANPAIATAAAIGLVVYTVGQLAESWQNAKIAQLEYYNAGKTSEERLKNTIEILQTINTTSLEFKNAAGRFGGTANAVQYLANELIRLGETRLDLNIDTDKIKEITTSGASAAAQYNELKTILNDLTLRELDYLQKTQSAAAKRNAELAKTPAILKKYQEEFQKAFAPTKTGTEGEIERLNSYLNFLLSKLQELGDTMPAAELQALKDEIAGTAAALENVTGELDDATAAADAHSKAIDQARQSWEQFRQAQERANLSEYARTLADFAEQEANIRIGFSTDPDQMEAELNRLAVIRARFYQQENEARIAAQLASDQAMAEMMETADQERIAQEYASQQERLKLFIDEQQKKMMVYDQIAGQVSTIFARTITDMISQNGKFKLNFQNMMQSLKSLFFDTLSEMLAKWIKTQIIMSAINAFTGGFFKGIGSLFGGGGSSYTPGGAIDYGNIGRMNSLITAPTIPAPISGIDRVFGENMIGELRAIRTELQRNTAAVYTADTNTTRALRENKPILKLGSREIIAEIETEINSQRNTPGNKLLTVNRFNNSI